MSETLLITNLMAWVAQACALAAAAGALMWLVRLRDPKASLAIWQLALLAIVLLPAIQPWREPTPIAGGTVEVSQGSTRALPSAPPRINLRGMILPILAAGIGIKLLWLAVGVLQLRRERRRSSPFELHGELERLRRDMEVLCEVRLSARLASPATFGWRDPVILLPESFPSMPESRQVAMLCHELEHIRRGDWTFALVEEALRAALWFHPAVWWLLGRIQLSREQVVDRAVVRRTSLRNEYLETLLAVAGERVRAAMIPAPSFLKRRHLAHRVAALIMETPMSKTRLFTSFVSVLGLAAVAACLAALQFPMSAPAQTIKMSGGRLLHHGPLYYPPEARLTKAEGAVVVEANINEKGEVVDARVLSGPEPLRRAALRTVLDFHYSKEVRGPATFQVALDYKLPNDRVPEGNTPPPSPPPPPPPPDSRVRSIRFLGTVPPDMQQEILSKLPVREGGQLNADTYASTLGMLREIDDHLYASWGQVRPAGGRTEALMIIGLREHLAPPPPPPPAPIGGIQGGVPGGVAGGINSVQRVKVGGDVQSAKLIHQPKPIYPAEARQARIQGQVRFEVRLNAEGTVAGLTLVSGHPLLVEVAQEAVQQWRYEPTLLNGRPVEVVTIVDVNFTLIP